ncbi:MAG: hypothetical protein V3T17_04170 [Pseudomonadales bacterium]
MPIHGAMSWREQRLQTGYWGVCVARQLAEKGILTALTRNMKAATEITLNVLSIPINLTLTQ